MPIIISSSGGANIDAIKKYFCSEYVTNMIASDFGVSFEKLTGGEYKLLLEPVAYFTFQGQQVAMTAHEAALYDQQLSGGLRSKMGFLTHQNLPLAMFLETPDLGFPAFGGPATDLQPNSTILSSLGLGTVTYTKPPETPPEAPNYDVEYRVNTEVVTAVTLSTSREINPDSPARVTFNISGRSYRMSDIVIPKGESQVVWCKWTTPATEQTVTINVSTNKGSLSASSVTAKIVDLNKNPPPDPKATDRNDSFRPASPPRRPVKTSARWTVWWARWHPFWVWIHDWEWVEDEEDEENGGYWEDNGWWEDKGWYDFFTNIYTARLSASSQIEPDEKVPTASGNSMKSGYGVNNEVEASFTSNAPNSHVAGAQTAVSYFPEFRYNTYWRLLDLTSRGSSSRLEFKQNQYSTYNRRAHFTPVWYPDGSYTVYTWLADAWTPDGMLSMNLTDSVNIDGAIFDDWHIGKK